MTKSLDPNPDTDESRHPWYGVPATGTIQYSHAVPVWATRGIANNADTTRVALGEMSQLAYAGKTPVGVLVALASSPHQHDEFTAAADPKLPSFQRSSLVFRATRPDYILTYRGNFLATLLLQNPCLTPAEVEQIASACHVSPASLIVNANEGSPTLAALIYEHPHTGETRRQLLLSPASSPSDSLSGVDSPDTLTVYSIEGALLRCASLHLSLTTEELDALAARWMTSFTQAVSHGLPDLLPRKPDQSLDAEWRQNLSLSAARLCTHPAVRFETAQLLLQTLRDHAIGTMWQDTLEAWVKLSQRPRESDWLILQHLSSSSADYFAVLLASLSAMSSSPAHSLDGTIVRLGIFDHSRGWRVMRDRILDLIYADPMLVRRIDWTHELVRTCLLSENKIIRQIGLQGIECLPVSLNVPCVRTRQSREIIRSI